MKIKLLLLAACLVAVVSSAAEAHGPGWGRPGFYFGVYAPPLYFGPPPLVIAPRPVYVAPPPMVYPAPAPVYPAPAYGAPAYAAPAYPAPAPAYYYPRPY